MVEAFESASVDDLNQKFETGLNLIRSDIANDLFASAFEILGQLKPLANDELLSKSLASLFHELVGAEAHLTCNMALASSEYARAIELSPANASAQLKALSLLLEMGESKKAAEGYDKLFETWSQPLSSTPSDDFSQIDGEDAEYSDAMPSPTTSADIETPEKLAINRAWLLIHRATLWVTRDETGSYLPDAINKSLGDLELSLSDSGNFFSFFVCVCVSGRNFSRQITFRDM